MKLLLTSAGIKNAGIRAALLDLLGKPIEESNALAIPTGMYGHPAIKPTGFFRFISGREPETPMVELGWQSVGILELTALPSLVRERWEAWVHDSDVFLVAGGDALYLAHWVRESGLFDLLPKLADKVWVGLSGGSMAMTPRIGEEFMHWRPPNGEDRALGLVDFSIFPHLDHPSLPTNTLAAAQKWAARLPGPAYAVDDETAIKVIDGEAEVISEGQWHRLNG